MARPVPLQSSFRAAFRRLGVFRQDIRETVDAIVPVIPIGRDWDQTSRPLWVITAENGDVGGQFPSHSITSSLDIEIYAIDYALTFFGSAAVNLAVIATPPASYIPLLNGLVAFISAVRPRLSFDIGNTLVLAGTNPAVLPFSAAMRQGAQEVGTGAPRLMRFVFESPLILPATMFLTVQNSTAGNRLRTTWHYRELHTFQGT